MAARLWCKSIEVLVRTLTYLRTPKFACDPTSLLLQERTPLQQVAEEAPPLIDGTPPKRLLLVIPFRDQWALTERCVASLLRQNLGGLEICLALVDNGSNEEETQSGLSRLKAATLPPGWQVRVIVVEEAFNFSRLNNAAVKACRDFASDWLLCLNNDVEALSPDTVSRLVTFASQRAQVGAVGCTLVYSDRQTIQHLFVAPGVKIVAAHPLKGFKLNPSWQWFSKPRAVAAVTGAVLLVSMAQFEAVGGFDEELPTLGQDVDLCLKLQRRGLVNWTIPDIVMVHHESISRGKTLDARQVAHMYAVWGDFLTKNPFYSRHFSRWSETPALRLGEGPYPWRRVLRAAVDKVLAR